MSSEESNKMSQKIPSQDSHSNIEEMMQAIIDAENIDYNDMAGGECLKVKNVLSNV